MKQTTFITSEFETSGKNKISSVKIKNPSKYYLPARKKITGPIINILLELCNHALMKNKITDQWSHSVLT